MRNEHDANLALVPLSAPAWHVGRTFHLPSRFPSRYGNRPRMSLVARVIAWLVK